MTRRARAACLAGLLLAGQAAAEPPPAPLRGAATTAVRTAPLAPGEQLLELGAMGFATARADRATFTASFHVEAPDMAAAEARYQARLAELRAALRALGLPGNAVLTSEENPPGLLSPEYRLRVDPSAALQGAVAELVAAADGAPVPEEPPPGPLRLTGTVVIQVDDVSRVDAVTSTLERLGARDVMGPIYAASDLTATLRAARLDALARVRARAAAVAAAANMRVARLVRVSERNATDFYTLAWAERAAVASSRPVLGPFEVQNSPDIRVAIIVGADFALVPR